MKNVEVVAAVIQDGNKILATRRGYGDFIGMWEFPGGKIEENETREVALIREIKEELDADIEVGKFLTTVEYDYPKFHLMMHCYLCHLKESKITLVEHSDAKWLESDELSSIDWLPADIEVVDKIKKLVR
ncbi:MAG: (deoxy)nucleoside triphosphate pyrophosphohydrolase [Bacilli bacterium]|nr:(deoxy)nucleoside triphosphate pyrophosphohydrolase [Bacilli bacterium]